MLYQVETEIGSLILEKEAVGSLIMDILDRQEGKLWISNHKGRILGRVARLSGMNPIDYMEFSMESNSLSIRIYLILRFGISIRTMTHQLIQEIKESLKSYTGLDSNVTLVVNGVLSKQLAKRNIEIKG